MEQFAGLDVSLKEISICIVDDAGEVVARGVTPTDPQRVAAFFAEKRVVPGRIVHESGQLSIWLQRELSRLGLPATCIDARMAHKALSARVNKSDRTDAEGLAQLARTGWFTPIHVRSENADRLRTLIGARDRLIRLRKDLEGHVRGVLKTFGIRMTGVARGRNRAGFREQLAAAGEADPALAILAESFLPAHERICMATEALERELRAIAKANPLARRLMTVPGVGVMVALGFIATVDDASRFRKATDVGAYLGLTPRRYQSGAIDRTGRISKCGDPAMRALLFEAATALIRQVKRFSALRSWAVRLAARKGFKKAAVAAARKLAVIMLTLWRNDAEFEWTREAKA